MTYTITSVQMFLLIALALWELVWKGGALWRAAHRDQPKWFIALLFINSAGFLPIIYLLMTDFSENERGIPRVA